MKWVFLFFVSGIVVYVTTIFFRLGFHKDVVIDQYDSSGFHTVYKLHHGPYHNINAVISEVEKWASENNIPCPKTFGYYLDNPDIVEEVRLRSHAGCVLRTKPPLVIAPLNYEFLPATTYIRGTFDGAPSIGPLKVYPSIKDWIAEKRLKWTGTVLEIYTLMGATEVTTEYLFPVEK